MNYFWDSFDRIYQIIGKLLRLPAISDFEEQEKIKNQKAVYREIMHLPIRLYIYAPP